MTEKRRDAGNFVPGPVKRALARAGLLEGGLMAFDGHAALLWSDLRGFMPLSVRLASGGPRGVEALHRILASHYRNLLATIERFGGEPVLYAGDGLLAVFPSARAELWVGARAAAACAAAVLVMPRTLDERGEPLACNVFVSVGALALSAVGTPSLRLAIAHGEALADLASIASLRAPGQVLVTAATQAQLDPTPAERLGEGFVLIGTIKHAALPAPIEDASCPPERLVPFLTATVRAGITSGDFDWVAELRRVSCVFAQILGFDHVSPGATDRLQRLVVCVAPVIEAHEATLHQLTIDDKGVYLVAYQGLPPLAHPDDPERAVSLAMALREALAAEQIVARFGVTTGNAYCGLLGTPALSHYTVIGSTLNLAARLMTATDRGILVDEATMRAAGDGFHFDATALITIKGHEHPVPVSTPIGRKRRDALRYSKLVGRTAERAALRQELATAKCGACRVVILRGPLGIGKSHVLSEILEHAVAEGTRVLRGAGAKVTQDAAYHAFRPVLEELFAAQSGPLEMRRASVLIALGDLAERSGLLNAVLPLHFEDSPGLALISGEQCAAATRELLVELVTRSAGRGLVLALENAHWLDAASLELVRALAADSRRVLLVLNCTVEHGESLQELDIPGARVIDLSTLAADDQRVLACDILGTDSLTDDLAAFIVSRSGGNPLFLRELLRALVDAQAVEVDGRSARVASGASLEALALPGTVHALVVQRLDRLARGPQLTLKVASVVGMSFPTVVVSAVHPLAMEAPRTRRYLTEMQHVGLIDPMLVDEREGFVFHDNLVGEVAYRVLPFEQRRALHRAIATWWETLDGGPPETHLVTLAHHWEHADEPARAVDYLEREAARAFSAGLASTSVAVGLRAAKLLGVVFPTDTAEIRKQIGENLGVVLAALAGRPPSALLDLPALRAPRIERLLWLLPRVGPFTFQTRQIELFALMAVTGLRLAIEHGNGAPSADVYSMYSPVHRALTGDRIGAHAWSQLALDLDARHGGAMRPRIAFVHIWFHQHWVGPLEHSLPIAIEAAEVGLAGQELLFGCFNLSAHLVCLAALGRPLDEVERLAEAYLERNGRRVLNAAFHLIHERQVARAFAGRTRGLLSLSDDTVDEQADIASICATELANQIGYYLVSRVKLHVHAGDYETAATLGEQVLPCVPAFEGQIAEFELVQYRAIALLRAASDPAHRRELARGLVAIMRGFADLVPENFAHKACLLEAELALAEGTLDQAAYVTSAKGAAERGFDQDAGLAWELLGRAAAARGLPTRARSAFDEASAAYARWGAGAKLRLVDELRAGLV